MASGENQGLQIALIILFILVIMLSLASFFFFKGAQDWEKQARVDAEKAASAKTTADLAQTEVNELKQFIGMPAETNREGMQTAHKEDMTKFSATLPAEKQFYRQALEEFFVTNGQVKGELVAAQDEISVLKESNAKFEEVRKQEVAAAIADKDKAVKELADERAKFMDGQKKAEEEKKDALAKHEEAAHLKDEEIDKLKKDIESSEKKVVTVQVKNDELAKELRTLRGETPAVDDGEIRWINQRSSVVWINLGRSDNLRRQISFEVHAANSPAKDMTTRKGKIEVTQILGDHLAEARILDDDIRDPIVPGDKIYTSLWDASRPERFAIVGKIDFDGDNHEDRDRLKNLISISGGSIDAELDPDGKKIGEITVNTRYLIEGPVSGTKSSEPHKRMIEEARKNGVEIIGVDRFLDNIGWKSSPAVLRFGGVDANVEQYPVERPDGGVPVSPGSTTQQFKRRLPAARPVTAY